MRYVSTRGNAPPVTFSEAVLAGLAPDGGLYVPEVYPQLKAPKADPETVLGPYLAGDPLASQVSALGRAAFTFPVPLRDLRADTAVLDLFHGPTAAFKDVGARFLAEVAAKLIAPEKRPLVLVATSGDTGGAVAGAFYGRPGFEVAILYPKGRISARQEKQLTAWGGNIRAYRVNGTFDDCQRLVKSALGDKTLRARRPLVAANSISLGRLLPQQTYYAAAATEFVARHGRPPTVIVPTGNLGNAVAALWAKKLGFPLGRVVLALNANRAILKFLETERWEPGATIATLANAMDVGAASNIERLRHLYPRHEELIDNVSAVSVSNDEIRRAIADGPKAWGEIWCPHTATAVIARGKIPREPAIIVATASPAKFESIVEPLIGKTVPIPPALAELLRRPSIVVDIDAKEENMAKIVG